MPKYRLLTLQELAELEKEFIEYLVLNGITADDWEKIKANKPSHADLIIELFSDVIFESILRKVKFLESHSPKEIRTFQCLDEKIICVGLSAPDHSPYDLTNADFISRATKNPPEDLHIFLKEKSYSQSRETELFQMIQNGCSISDGKLFKALSLAL
ncbi:MAG: DUF6495 family protein [Cytophagaceae bacterium]